MSPGFMFHPVLLEQNPEGCFRVEWGNLTDWELVVSLSGSTVHGSRKQSLDSVFCTVVRRKARSWENSLMFLLGFCLCGLMEYSLKASDINQKAAAVPGTPRQGPVLSPPSGFGRWMDDCEADL